MSLLSRLIFASLLGFASETALANGVTMAVVAPQGGNFASLGQQILTGARVSAAATGDQIVAIDESCEENSGTAIAEKIVAAKADIAIGFLCAESLDTSLEALKQADIPAITLSVRAPILMEDALKKGWPLFRLAPDSTAEQRKLIEVILDQWANQPFALIEDGTIHSRELSEAIRNALEEKGMKPVFTDTLRPGQEQQIALVRRLLKTGATHVFIGADRSDVSIVARDAGQLKAKLTILGGETMSAADSPVPLTAGTQAVIQTLPVATEEAIAATVAIAATGNDKPVVVEGYMLPAHAAANIASQSVELAKTSGKSKSAILVETVFDTALGQIDFTDSHELSTNPYSLNIWQDGHFVAADQAVPVN